MRVAVIGTGISGLTAAHHLNGRADLTIFERADRLGGHANTVFVESERGDEAIDTGFIVFNDRNYPEFTAILDSLGIASRPSSMSFSFSDGKFEYTGRNLRGLFARRRSLVDPSHWRMLTEFRRFQRALGGIIREKDTELSLTEFLDRERFSTGLRDRVVVPLVASVWSAEPGQMGTFPVTFLARFLDNHGLLSLRDRPRWRTVEGGSWQYVKALTGGLDARIRTSSPIMSVSRTDEYVEVLSQGGEPERFDHVIIASHSDQALAMLNDPTRAEREVLGAVRYLPNETVLHTDTSLMPRRRAAWACWNYRRPGPADDRATMTYDMNRLQSLECRRRFLVTLNLTDRIDPEKIIEVIPYEHPVFNAEAIAAQVRWGEVSGSGRTHFCGAYWGNGFHEDGAVSGRRAAGSVLAAAGQAPGQGEGPAVGPPVAGPPTLAEAA